MLALALAGHGTNQEINALPWVDAPRLPAMDEARRLLQRLKARRQGSEPISAVRSWSLSREGLGHPAGRSSRLSAAVWMDT